MTDDIHAAGKEALETLRLMLMDEEVSDSARASAAKTLLERFMPKESEEERKRKAEERNAAIAEAKGILAEFTLAKSAGLYEPAALDQERPPEPDHAADGT